MNAGGVRVVQTTQGVVQSNVDVWCMALYVPSVCHACTSDLGKNCGPVGRLREDIARVYMYF